MKPSKQKIQPYQISNLLAITAIALSIISIFIVLIVNLSLRSNDKTLDEYIGQLQAGQARVTFCHDNQITPCTDDLISGWNTKHPDDAFNLRAGR